jgi:hypothetical protein
MKKLTALAGEADARVEIVKSARVVRLLEEGGTVVGVEYESSVGVVSARGNVVLATGCVPSSPFFIHVSLSLTIRISVDTPRTPPPAAFWRSTALNW